MKHKFRVGDKVLCKKGFTTDHNSRLYGGAGYLDPAHGEYILIIKSIIKPMNGVIYFFENNENGIYEFALEDISIERDRKLEKLFLSLPCDNSEI